MSERSIPASTPSRTSSQLHPHRAQRITMPGPYGPIVGLRAEPTSEATATVLLIPGYTGSKEDFTPLLDGCAEAGFSTVAIDLPGQHESPGPDNEHAYLPDELGRVVTSVAEHLAADSAAVLLLGHSYGGLVARAAALAGAPIAGLTLLASGPARLPDGPRRDALDIGEPLLRQAGNAAAYQLREAINARNPGWHAVPVELKDFLRARFLGSSAAGLLGMAAGLRSEPDRVDELARTLDSIPRMVVTGEHDDAWQVAEQQRMARRLGAEFALVPDAAHSPNTENPHGLLGILLPAWSRWVS